MSEMTAGDYALINQGNGFMNNPFVYLVLLWLFRGGYGYGSDNAAAQGSFTRAELHDGLEMQNLMGEVAGVRNAVYGEGSSVAHELCSGFARVNENIGQCGYNAQLAMCGIERNIDAVRAENAKNTCAITTAIHAEGEETRKMISEMENQRLRTDLQSAQLTLANANQTQNVLNALGRYVPYASNGCGCGVSW
ncbi:MAG: hypothetical protein KBT02_00100 [Treponema sp.]|nr:hypothetical protein [Candidatus Treponema caballi]